MERGDFQGRTGRRRSFKRGSRTRNWSVVVSCGEMVLEQWSFWKGTLEAEGTDWSQELDVRGAENSPK